MQFDRDDLSVAVLSQPAFARLAIKRRSALERESKASLS